MTPSPSPTPASSSSNSPQGSSPSNITSVDPSRPGFVPLTLPPISQLAYPSEYAGQSYHHDQRPAPGPSRSPSVPAPSLSDSYRRLRHGKQRSDDSLAASSSDNNTTPYGAIDDEFHTEPEETSPTGQVPKKKKRTRTLTTPRQSAVLHALLAQSRFPTTAMREEVGRSIGLSARKVQVWFQNQRQKARKPRAPSSSGTTIDLSRPPQFESFGSASNTDDAPVAGPSGTAGAFQGAGRGGSTSSYVSESSANTLPPRGLPASLHSVPHPPPEFIAPRHAGHSPPHPRGMPHSVESLSPNTEMSASRRASFDPSFPLPHHNLHYYPIRSTSFSGQHLRHSQSFGALGLSPAAERPIQLPPLRLENPNLQRTFTPRPSSTNPSEFHNHPSMPIPSLSPLEISAPVPRTFVDRSLIPPPFTLQPTPQWEWDRPLNPPVGPRPTPMRPRTSSDPVLPPLDIYEGRQARPLITQPWPLPDVNSPVGGPQRRSSEGAERFDPVHSVSGSYEGAERRHERDQPMDISPNRHSRHGPVDIGRPPASSSRRRLERSTERSTQGDKGQCDSSNFLY